ncbi:MAG: prolyl oligopeptidase family serine peptidase [Anaerolineae bacterium]|nr:prolyl oligopeptidase family serine peptidase [Anaerolineae bacterium]
MRAEYGKMVLDSEPINELPLITYFPEACTGEHMVPVIFFLHGSGERGTDLSLVELHGLPYEIKNGREVPAIVIAPQLPLDMRWAEIVPTLQTLLEITVYSHNINQDRMYLTGLSNGGQGTWEWAIAHPDQFAAIVPICGRSNPQGARKIAHLPIWVFHGEDDDVVPVEETTKMVKALEDAGADKLKVTIFPGVDHGSWIPAYADDALYEWLFAQKLPG